MCDPSPSDVKDIYVGRGSFGLVKFQKYREIPVAVKEFLPRTNKEDVYREACILQKLCHPYLPLFFGMCTLKKPYIVVMQYHGINGKSITLHDELVHHKLITNDVARAWITICTQLIEAFRYLHHSGVIHNDLKANNILFCHKFNGKAASSAGTHTSDFQIILIDFGKAIAKENGRMYHLSYFELQKYRTRFPHMAPEVVEGKERESTSSDIYAYGMLLKRIISANDCLSSSQLQDISEQCSANKPSSRPSAAKALETFEIILKKYP